MTFDNPFEMILYGVENIFTWLENTSVFGISIFSISMFVLLLSLFWRFILSPFFGRDGGSMTAGVSDVVSSNAAYSRRQVSEQRYQISEARVAAAGRRRVEREKRARMQRYYRRRY